MTIQFTIRVERAAERLEAIAELAPGYAAALVNLAGELRAAGSGEECKHGEDWAHRIADAVFGARDA